MIDNSGIEFFYTSTRRQHDAGILTVGHHVNRSMIVPPNTGSYSILGECSSQCTSAVKLLAMSVTVPGRKCHHIFQSRYRFSAELLLRAGLIWNCQVFMHSHSMYDSHP